MGNIDLDKIRKIKDSLKKGSSKEKGYGKFFYPQEGKNYLRILPCLDDTGLPFREVGVHFFPGKEAYNCPKVTNDEKCPICDFVTELYRSGTDESKKLANRIRASRRGAFLVLNRKEDDNTPKIWVSPPTMYEELVDILVSEDDFGQITDIKSGRDIVLKRKNPDKKSGGVVEYSINVLDVSTLADSKKEVKEILTNAPSLSDITILPFDELQEIIDKLQDKKEEGSSGSSEKQEKQEKEEEKEIKKPACFGEYDDEDDECDGCSHVRKCKKATIVSEKKDDDHKDDDKDDDKKEDAKDSKKKSEEDNDGDLEESLEELLENVKRKKGKKAK